MGAAGSPGGWYRKSKRKLTLKTSDLLKEIHDARERIRSYTIQTDLMHSEPLSEYVNGRVFLKMESEQHTGSFKARGSLNKILSLTDDQISRGLITASTGNHALGFARALDIAGLDGTIYLPTNASPQKIDLLSNFPVQLEFHGNSSLEAEIHARRVSDEEGSTWVSPYNDAQVIAGQGTIAMEVHEQLDNYEDILATVGGGGMISGVGIYTKSVRPQVKVVGTLPENSPEMAISLETGKVYTMDKPLETLSDGSAGGLEEDSITFPICQEVVDETLLVSETEIANAIRLIHETHNKVIEGSAGVAVAALIKNKERFKNRTVVVIICGGNISELKLAQILGN